MTSLDPQSATDGVRLLSHRPSVLYKVEHMATEPVDGDIAVEGLVLAGPALVGAPEGAARRALAVRARVPVRRAPGRRPGAAAARPTRCSTAAAPTGSPTSSRTGR